MPKKQEKKKKAFQRMCREKVKAGLVNRADGSWTAAQQSDRMAMMMREGYHLG